MTNRFLIPSIISMMLIFVSCSSQETGKEHSETPDPAPYYSDNKYRFIK